MFGSTSVLKIKKKIQLWFISEQKVTFYHLIKMYVLPPQNPASLLQGK